MIYKKGNLFQLTNLVFQLNKVFKMQLAFEINFQELGVPLKPICKRSRNSQYLACFGSENSVFIYSRKGEKVSSFASLSAHLIGILKANILQ
jgi:hypothetical protein